MKKLVALAMVGIMTMSLVVGCSNGSSDSSDSSTDTSTDTSTGDDASDSVEAEDESDITIRLLTRMAGTSTQVDVYNEIIAEFQELHPDVTIIDESQSDEDAFNSILATDISQGTVANIYRIQGVANLGTYIDAGLLMDVSDYVNGDTDWATGFSEASVSYFEVPGYDGVYGVPCEAGLFGFYYNADIFEAAGIEEFPETWDEFLVAIEMLNDYGVTPIAMGAQTTYMAGHIFNAIAYKWFGVEVAQDLGTRDLDWDSDEMLEVFTYYNDLIEAGAYDEDAAGMTEDIAMSQFQTGEAAMFYTGTWNISTLTDEAETPVADSIEFAKFPYFEEKPEYENHDMQLIVAYMIKGEMEGLELELTMELVQMLTDADAAKTYVEEASFLLPRSDIDYDEDILEDLLVINMELSGESEGAAVDIFDYDPITTMQDVVRNSLVSIFTGTSIEDAAAQIQSEIDSYEGE